MMDFVSSYRMISSFCGGVCKANPMKWCSRPFVFSRIKLTLPFLLFALGPFLSRFDLFFPWENLAFSLFYLFFPSFRCLKRQVYLYHAPVVSDPNHCAAIERFLLVLFCTSVHIYFLNNIASKGTLFDLKLRMTTNQFDLKTSLFYHFITRLILCDFKYSPVESSFRTSTKCMNYTHCLIVTRFTVNGGKTMTTNSELCELEFT